MKDGMKLFRTIISRELPFRALVVEQYAEDTGDAEAKIHQLLRVGSSTIAQFDTTEIAEGPFDILKMIEDLRAVSLEQCRQIPTHVVALAKTSSAAFEHMFKLYTTPKLNPQKPKDNSMIRYTVTFHDRDAMSYVYDEVSFKISPNGDLTLYQGRGKTRKEVAGFAAGSWKSIEPGSDN